MIAEQYKALQDKLNFDTGHFSSVSRMVRHPAYKEIVELGKDVIPIILDEFDRYLQTDEAEAFPGWWTFNVLDALSGAKLEGGRAGVLVDWVGLWVKWGEENGHLAKDRPKHWKTPPVVYKGWVIVGQRHGEESVLCPKRDPRNAFEKEKGTAAWVSKIDAARKVDDGWWKKHAWVFDTKKEAEIALDLLNEKIKAGECSDFNKPERAWVEEI